MSDFKGNRFEDSEKLKIAPSEQGLGANIENWLESLTSSTKAQFGHYASIIRTKKVPEEWDRELVPTQEVEKKADENERYGKRLDKRIEERNREVKKWNNEIKPKFNALIQSSLSKESTVHIKSRYREEYKKAIPSC